MASPKMIKTLMAVCKAQGIDEDTMRNLILAYTNGRTESRTRITDHEVRTMLADIQPQTDLWQAPPGDKMRKKIISMAHEIGWQKEVRGELKADMEAINIWCQTRGQYKKPLNEHSVAELTKLVTQFEQVYLSYIKSVSA